MQFTFSLCPECRNLYGELRYDPTCEYSLCPMPLCSLIWPDEHPDQWYRRCCEKCQESLRRLAHARTHLWRHGQLPRDHRELWEEAKAIIPNWPGFSRLSLDQEQMDSLDGCGIELDEMMGVIARSFPNITLSDKGGGQVEFVAQRPDGAIPAKDPKPAKRWWQIWK